MSNTKKIIRADLDEIVEAVVGEVFGLEAVRDSIIAEDDNFLITPTELCTALERFVVEERIPFDKALDRASLNAFDRIEFIKGANWAKSFLTTPKKGGEDEA